jgi:hypothetical protein
MCITVKTIYVYKYYMVTEKSLKNLMVTGTFKIYIHKNMYRHF